MRVMSHERETAVLVRMSHERKAALMQEAKDLGITFQALGERKLLGITDAQSRRHGRVPRKQTELPLTG